MASLERQSANAVLIGLEPHLTVPSRGDSCRVDLWFSLARNTTGPEWQVQFDAVTRARRGELVGVRRLELVQFSSKRAWIVARGVQRSEIADAAVETHVRAFVSDANMRVGLPVLDELVADLRPSWRSSAKEFVRTMSDRFRSIPVEARADERPAETHAVVAHITPAKVLAARISGEYNQDSSGDRSTAESVA